MIIKTDEEWRKELTREQYRVTRRAGTERAFSGKYWDCHEDGLYACVCCGMELFDSAAKFDSGTGWPSFSEPIEARRVVDVEDKILWMRRVEVLCANCGAHLGHVFPDGPPPGGQRYCVNSVSLDLKPREASPE